MSATPADQLTLILTERLDVYGRRLRERLDGIDGRVEDVQQHLCGQIAGQRRSMLHTVVLVAVATNLGLLAVTVGVALWLA